MDGNYRTRKQDLQETIYECKPPVDYIGRKIGTDLDVNGATN